LTMRTHVITTLIIAGIICAIGFGIGSQYAGLRSSRAEELAEFKIHYANLQRTDLTPQLREYLKSRLYFLASELEPRDLSSFHFDFGPVDEKLLAGASGIKGPETESDTYKIAMAKHNQKDNRP